MDAMKYKGCSLQGMRLILLVEQGDGSRTVCTEQTRGERKAKVSQTHRDAWFGQKIQIRTNLYG